jgi:hypothetical protein
MIKSVINTAVEVTVRQKKIPGPYVGMAWREEGEIEIDPRQSEREYLLTLVHEWLHCALPRLSERSIIRLEQSLGGMLWSRGYRKKRSSARK